MFKHLAKVRSALMFHKRKSILFFSPAYYVSFLLRDKLRDQGWKADVYVPPTYPEGLLYSSDVFSPSDIIAKFLDLLHKLLPRCYPFISFLAMVLPYRFLVIYDSLDVIPSFSIENRLHLRRWFGSDFRFSLWFLKLLQKRIVLLPSGITNVELLCRIDLLDEGNVLANCGSFMCDAEIALQIMVNKRYADRVIADGFYGSTQLDLTYLKHTSLDLQLWHPDIHIPDEFRLPASANLRVLHAFYNKHREEGGRNIKGSPFVTSAIERLRAEGHPVEYLFLTDTPARNMRFYQVQADIVVDQLIYGCWGAMGRECMALGKPVICYVRPQWKKHFLSVYPEYTDLPIVEATHLTVYDTLKKLIVHAEFRKQKAFESRRFAEQHFDVANNVFEFIRFLNRLDTNISKDLCSSISPDSHALSSKRHFPIPLDTCSHFAELRKLFALIYHNRIRTVILYGAGHLTSCLLRLLHWYPLTVSCIVDDNPPSGCFCGIPVIRPSQLDNFDHEYEAIIITSKKWKDIMLSATRCWAPGNIPVITLF